jgi:hypothetical protein
MKPKLLSECEFYMSEESISLTFKQAPYEICSMYRTKVMIIFNESDMPKNAICYDFCTPAPQKLHDIGC